MDGKEWIGVGRVMDKTYFHIISLRGNGTRIFAAQASRKIPCKTLKNGLDNILWQERGCGLTLTLKIDHVLIRNR